MFLLKNVSKQYGAEFALNCVSMEIGKGMNFIVGASGSGKTTLLKIISGMEPDFEGEVFYGDKDIKTLMDNEKSNFYNNVFGFVWQDFNLIEDNTVLENVLLPTYLKNSDNEKFAKSTLNDLKISDLADKKVKYLSGGQKQRVAIARELMKNPQVIIADEPTSALDEKTSKTTIDILRALSKKRMIIVVTHDTSMIQKGDNIFELDKGELISETTENPTVMPQLKQSAQSKLSFWSALAVDKINVKNKPGSFIISALTIIIASVLLLMTFGGMLGSRSAGEFDELIKKYGDGLLDISVVSSYMSAGATEEKNDNKPSGDVSQDINGLYSKYVNDERVTFTAFLQAFDNIKIQMDGKDYSIKSFGSVPVINKLTAGKMPGGDANEITVPESFVTSTGLTNESILGKELQFNTSIYNWSSGEPVLCDAKITATVVGVADTAAIYEYEGETDSFNVDDAFFFSKTAIDNMRGQAGIKKDEANFLIRAKTPSDMIAVKDEINKLGISPLGRFELVEDMVRLESQTTEQSGFASVIIAVLSVVLVAAVFLITGALRKREYAIYKVSGFSRRDLLLLSFVEVTMLAVCSVILLVVLSPLFNLATQSIFTMNILKAKMLFTGAALVLPISAVAYFMTVINSIKANAAAVLKSGDR